MLRHMQWDNTGLQRGGESLVTLADVAIPETLNEVAAGQTERLSAMGDEPRNRVAVFCVTSLYVMPPMSASAVKCDCSTR